MKQNVLMATRRTVLAAALGGMTFLIQSSLVETQELSAATRIYNTVKQKIAAGHKVVGGTVSSSDPDVYCAMANAGYDFLWIEMQHSPLTYQDAARMIWACRDSPAIPFIRVPDATDIGALGIIVPMVASVNKIESAVRFAKYPPHGVRSQGGGQYRRLWGDDYRTTANDNIMVVAMIESPAGVAIADKIANVPGVDVVFAASTDIRSFSGASQGQPEYEALIMAINDATLKAGRVLGGPQAWMNREGFSFFQGPGTTALIRLGVRTSLETAPARVAPIEGAGR